MQTITLTLCKTLLLLSCFSCRAEEPAFNMQRFSEQVSIVAPTSIKIVNPYGDIRIRKADDDQFIYHGVAQSEKSQKVSLVFSEENNQITAIIEYSDPENITKLDRYDLALIVPEMVSLDIEIERGTLTTKGLSSAIKVRSSDSDIQVKTSKAVDLFTKTGSIELNLKAGKGKSQSNIQTHHGQVKVFFHDDMPRVEVNTGNFVTSNSVPVLNSLSKAKRTAYYGDTKNPRHLKIKTDTGLISLIDLAQQ